MCSYNSPLPEQVRLSLFSLYPVLQLHVKEPGLLLQTCWQLLVEELPHSLKSVVFIEILYTLYSGYCSRYRYLFCSHSQSIQFYSCICWERYRCLHWHNHHCIQLYQYAVQTCINDTASFIAIHACASLRLQVVPDCE